MYYDPFNLILGRSPIRDNKKKHKKKILWAEEQKKLKIKKLKQKIKDKKKKKIEEAKHKVILHEENINLHNESWKQNNNIYINDDIEDIDTNIAENIEKEFESIFERDADGKIVKDEKGNDKINEDKLKILTETLKTKFPMMRLIYKQALWDADLDDPTIIFNTVMTGNISKQEYDEKKQKLKNLKEKKEKGEVVNESDIKLLINQIYIYENYEKILHKFKLYINWGKLVSYTNQLAQQANELKGKKK